MVKTGLEKIFEPEHAGLLSGCKIGLIVHPASVNKRLAHAADLFFERKDFRLTALFGPQHGIRGETQDNMIEWQSFTDSATGLPNYSLYGQTREPTAEMLKDIDVLVFDVQDVGTRIYTFIWTMALSMTACAREGKRFVVLDRPNPIGGVEIEGNVLDPAFKSFVGLLPIPMRHGMTVGELALMFNKAFGIGCDLTVVEMDGWRRDMFFDETKLPWVLPSPNMPTLDTAVVYPGAVLFEGTNISEGRGTTRPFELIGADWLDARSLAETMNHAALPGVLFRVCHFMPTFHKMQGRICNGVQFHVTDTKTFKPFISALELLIAIRNQNPEKFAWKQPPYEYEYEKLPIDMMFGTDRMRIGIENGGTASEIYDEMKNGIDDFDLLRKEFYLY